MIWNDEFDGTSLNPSKWDYEVVCWGGGNNENQCYVQKPDVVFVRNGNLNIHPIRVPGDYQGTIENCTNNNDNSCTWTRPVISGRLRTLKAWDGSWTFGKLEMRAKLPRGDFLWPAFWMLPTDSIYGSWAASGEIDILEFRGQRTRETEHTLHFGGQWPNNRYEGSGRLDHGIDLTADFHTYAIEWYADIIHWFVEIGGNWKLVRSATLNRSFYSGVGQNPYWADRQPFDQRFHFILNIAIGGNFFPSGEFGTFNPDYHPQTWTQDFIIDYVRVWARTGEDEE